MCANKKIFFNDSERDRIERKTRKKYVLIYFNLVVFLFSVVPKGARLLFGLKKNVTINVYHYSYRIKSYWNDML